MEARGRGTIPSLDGIRAVAIGLVFAAHLGLDHIVPGGLGVTVFFALSGYLITTLLRDEYARTGGIDFRLFYLRRVIRLFPPLYLVVAFSVITSRAGFLEGTGTVGGVISILLYYPNYYAAMFGPETMPAGLGPLWSLAIEEHFYLFFPPLALILVTRPRSTAIRVLAGLCAAALVWRLVLYVGIGVSENYIYSATDTRIDSLAFGCLLAFAWNPRDRAPSADQHPARMHLWVIGALALLLFTLVIRDDVFRSTLRYSLQGMALMVLIYWSVT
ncbi:acyltransferase [uncultured Abyssibacter sp.]|uniref:acyltransferase family protein n=1 Tax=uncultured Abyssibacter sp. TaxID=2320202 RepID=UPI0032B1D2D6